MNIKKRPIRKSFQILTALMLVSGYFSVLPIPNVQAANYYVDTLVDENDHSCSDGDCSLRDAVEVSSTGDYIGFTPAMAESTFLLSSEIVIDKDLTIAGYSAGADENIKIDGGNSTRIFSIAAGVEVWIQHLDLINGAADYGAGIYSEGDLMVTWSEFVNNQATVDGGAIYSSGDLSIDFCTFSSNSALQDGGAIYNNGTSDSIFIQKSTFTTNSAGIYGGAIQTVSGTITTFRNITIYNNSAWYGGGVNNEGYLSALNTTITDNFANISGGGLRSGAGSTIGLPNSLIANSTSGGDCVVAPGGSLSASTYYLVEDGSCSASITGDPLLDELADNGGYSETMALLYGSPAIDTGDDGSCWATDQRGVSRPQEAHCDLGAYERKVVVTTGLYDPDLSQWSLKKDNATGDADQLFTFGPGGAGWKPLSGDWNNNDVDSIGLYNPATSKWYLKFANESGPVDTVFRFGPVGMGWIPIKGDWDGNGKDSAGFYSPITSKFYMRNSHTPGAADTVFRFGPAGMGWLPIVGDWDDDGIDSAGLYNPITSKFYLRNSHTAGTADEVVRFGAAGAGWLPIAGDWEDVGTDYIGLYNPADSMWYLRYSHADGKADKVFQFGPASSTWTPLTGMWE